MAKSGYEGQRFGGDWTERKLEVLHKYLSSYLIALKNQPFRLTYIDGFAGSGFRADDASKVDGELFEEFEGEETKRFFDGSARRALKLDPGFHEYVFIERNPAHAEALQSLRVEFSALANRTRIECGDANDVLFGLASDSNYWRNRRAVVFLDPFGAQVKWSTVQALAATQCIDLWYLFPTGTISRLLPHSGNIPAAWSARLDAVFGTHDWSTEFYRSGVEGGLFGAIEHLERKADFAAIDRYLIERLCRVFGEGVVENVGRFDNSKGVRLFSFVFAASNPAGAKPAKRIAQHLLKGL